MEIGKRERKVVVILSGAAWPRSRRIFLLK